MKPFHIQKILIPIDFSETSMLALDHAVHMAGLFNAGIVLAHVIEIAAFASQMPYDTIVDKTKVLEVVKKKLQDVTAKIHGGNPELNVELSIKSGKISKKLQESVLEHKADIIIMGTHGASGFEEFFIGSNAYKMVSNASVPVISVQTENKKLGFSNVLLPIDNTDASRQKTRYAIELAKKYNCKVHVTGLLRTRDELIVKTFGVKIGQVEGLLKENKIDFETNVIQTENLAKATLDQAKKINADLVIIMTEQDEDLAGMLIGPYAQQIVNHSRIPVMSIRPQEGAKGFATNFQASNI
jgi:nucleotide-binding universal stress UspA family protein